MVRFALIGLLVFGGCFADDEAINPPPKRETQARIQPVAPTPDAGSAALVVRQRDESRHERIGAQEAIVLHLSDELANAKLESKHLKAGFEVIKPTIRSYANPWAAGAHAGLQQRLAWTTGSLNQWNMRAAIALPSPCEATWDVTIPAAARLRFDYAAATNGGERALGPITAVLRAGKKEIWRSEDIPGLLKTLKRWKPVTVDLAAFANQRTQLTLSISSGVTDTHTDTALLAEAVITTTDPAAARAATGLDVADNVLMVIVDSQRADTISPLRHARRLPHLFDTMESLVEQGTTFTQARSAGNATRLSTFTFLSGQYPRYGRFHSPAWDLTPEEKLAFYAGDPPLLPRLLRKMGYRTWSVGNNAFLFGNQEISLDAGWDSVTDHRNSDFDTPWMTDSAIEWIKRHKSQRWYVVLNYNAPHKPYWPPDSSWLKFKPKLEGIENFKWGYLGEIKYVDEHLARVIQTLDELDLSRRTLVMLFADHGEMMDFRHQCWNKTFDYACVYAHGNTLFDEEVHVPLVFRQPNRVPEGTTIDAPISLVDLPPTILGMLGVAPHPDHLGRDFSGTILGGPAPKPAPMVAEARLSTALVWRDHKYIVHDPKLEMNFKSDTQYDRSKSFEELYDLRTDPDELMNLANIPGTAMLQVMRDTLRGMQDELAARRPAWNTVRLHRGDSEGRFRGVIKTTGRFVAVEALDTGLADRSTITSPGTLTVSIDAGTDPTALTGFRFHTRPPNAPLTFSLDLDDRPIDADRFYVGAYGLKLLSDPVTLSSDADFALAAAPAEGPTISTGVQAGVFFWRESHQLGAGAATSSEDMDSSVRQMMKDWGYN